MHDHHDHSAGGAAIADKDKTICPVMHVAVSKQEAESKDLVRTYAGKKYYLCCGTCAQMFDKNPNKYTDIESRDSE
jgi:YHS domain-containing protein